MLLIMNMMPDRLAADRQNQIKKLELLLLVDILLIWFFLCAIYLNSTINSTTFLFQGYSILGFYISAKLTIQIAVESLTSDIELLSTVYL